MVGHGALARSLDSRLSSPCLVLGGEMDLSQIAANKQQQQDGTKAAPASASGSVIK